MSRPDIEGIKARMEKTTPGPWNHNKDGIITQTKHITRDVWVIPKNMDDITFIANARTDIPDLLDYIDKLEDENERLNNQNKGLAIDLMLEKNDGIKLQQRIPTIKGKQAKKLLKQLGE